MGPPKPTLKIIFLGNPNAGKSALVGQLITKLGNRKTLEQREIFDYSKILIKIQHDLENDAFTDENIFDFQTSKYNFKIVDVFGHRNFIKNIILGKTRPDCAILVISFKENELEDILEKHLKPQLSFAQIVGIKQLVIGYNEITTLLPSEKYIKLQDEFKKLLKDIGYNLESIYFLHFSTINEENIFKEGIHCKNFNFPVKTLLEALDSFSVRNLDVGPLRIPIQDVYRIGGIGTVPIGRVESGILKPGMKVAFAPLNKPKEIASIETYRAHMNEIPTGFNIGFHVPNLKLDEIRRGYVCCELGRKLAQPVKNVLAWIYVLPYYPSISTGLEHQFHCHTANIRCSLKKIKNRLCRRTGKMVENKPLQLRGGEIGTVVLEPALTYAFETYADFPALGHFKMVHEGVAVAIGVIKENLIAEEVILALPPEEDR